MQILANNSMTIYHESRSFNAFPLLFWPRTSNEFGERSPLTNASIGAALPFHSLRRLTNMFQPPCHQRECTPAPAEMNDFCADGKFLRRQPTTFKARYKRA
jgi:hypothetical protein